MADTHRRKEIEQKYVHRLRRHLSDFPIGKIFCRERPDFIIESGGTTTGIEVRAVYQEYTSNRNNTAKEHYDHLKVVECAGKLYIRDNGRPARVVVLFKQRADIANPKEIATRLHEVVFTNVQRQACNLVLKANDLPASLRSTIQWVEVWLLNEDQPSVWTAMVVNKIHEISPQQIQEVLNEKEPKLVEYRKACQVNWLLLVIPGRRPSGNLSLTSRATQERYHSCFDRVFLLDYFENHLVELVLCHTPNDV